MKIDKIEPKSIKDILYDRLKTAIIKGELKPGERLIEQELSEMFDVSRTPLREAIQKLETEELLTRVNSGGVKVSELSERRLKEIYDVRKALECMIVKHVALEWKESDINQLAAIVKKVKDTLNFKKDEECSLLKRLSLDASFHNKLCQIYGNQVCIKILNQLQTQISRYSFIAMHQNQRFYEAAKEHLELFELIKKRKAEEAAGKMLEHLTRAEETTLSRLKNLKDKLIV